MTTVTIKTYKDSGKLNTVESFETELLPYQETDIYLKVLDKYPVVSITTCIITAVSPGGEYSERLHIK